MNSASIIQEFETSLRGFVRSRVSNPADADDVLQEILLKLHRGSGSLADGERVAGWVFRVARNTVIDFYRKSATRREVPDSKGEHAHELEPLFDATAEAELAYCVRPFVDQLDDRYREAIVMVDFDGLTHAEAAKRAGMSISGMKSRVQRGRVQLRGEIEECCRIEQDGRGKVVGYEPRECDC